MRALLVGDLHLRDHPSVNCTQAALDDVWAALDWIATISSDFDITIFAGDVIDNKNPAKTSHRTVRRLIDVFQRTHNAWCVAGNHDLSNDRLESLDERQPLGVVIASGAIHHLQGWHPEFPIFGQPWLQDWMDFDARHWAFQDFRARERSTQALVVTHAPLFPEGQEPPYEALPLDGPYGLHRALTAHEEPTSVYHGHIHDWHGSHQAADVPWITYANFGSLNRYRLVPSDITRTIGATSWDSTSGDFEFLPYPDMLPAAKIFRLDAAAAKKAESRSLDAFLDHVGRSTIDVASAHGIKEHIRASDAPEEVRSRAVRLVEDVEG